MLDFFMPICVTNDSLEAELIRPYFITLFPLQRSPFSKGNASRWERDASCIHLSSLSAVAQAGINTNQIVNLITLFNVRT